MCDQNWKIKRNLEPRLTIIWVPNDGEVTPGFSFTFAPVGPDLLTILQFIYLYLYLKLKIIIYGFLPVYDEIPLVLV